ncbi:MAG: Dam family site-specific DNA-(adenine-N6)-methyltransferase, partial [Candidatus Caenarcaniphilales bacterium]|nr:Dam family site-specific DNA-(adenine-N6)-methyltransferase [Candidatus Caenarcaniphilales bacterium]
MLLDIPKRAKPVLKWAGGKSSLLKQFKSCFPEKCKRYFEPFLGGAAVFLALNQDIPAIVNDSNQELFNMYSVIRDEPQKLMQELKGLTEKYCEEFYYELRTLSFESKIQKAARTIFLNKTGFNGLYRQNSNGGFNVPFGKRKKCPQLYEEENLLIVSSRLKNAELLCLDFEEVINLSGPGDFVYCDPPYHPLSSTSSFNNYQAGGFAEAEQKRLTETCFKASERGATVAISNSSSAFIQEIY